MLEGSMVAIMSFIVILRYRENMETVNRYLPITVFRFIVLIV
ncbi:hypothetical protein HMPREF3218_0200147 [Prevotella bivia]|nr:hypothetical protein HMPREF3218_0200147 [Prevotella bivia]